MPVEKYVINSSDGAIVEALQHTCERSNKSEMSKFHRGLSGVFGSPAIFIETDQGSTLVNKGDWVIKYNDKFTALTDERFKATHTLAE